MSNRVYDWKRFWCPREGHISLSDGGYLYDPDTRWGHFENPDLVSFEAISQVPCLLLLGEPGIGKTRTMKAEQEAIQARVREEGGETMWLDLRSYGSEDRFFRNLFESAAFVAWQAGKYRLHVFLDSLDECLLRIDTMATLLLDELQKYPVDRLCLRIACRTAEWPSSLENGLKELWGEDEVGAYELAPLRRVDVAEAAKANGLEPRAFLREIDRKEVVPLAVKPVTLDFLLRRYRQTGELPSTQAELYFEGCRLLCEETNESRRGAGLTGDLSAEQRMVVAARIAAATVFANRYAIWTDVDRGDVPDADVTIQELCGGMERIGGHQFEVTEAAVREALGIGLFSSRGQGRMGWAHQTYAEFLGPWYLHQREMTLAQMMSLMVHPGDAKGRVVPQLHEAAAWLAGMQPDVFHKIVRTDPEVLLRSDVATVQEKERATLVGALLNAYDEEELLPPDPDVYRNYAKLAHSGMTAQLRPYICDAGKGVLVRAAAIGMAAACRLRELQGDLADIALGAAEPLPIRKRAASAICWIGDDEGKSRLKPLAIGEIGEDPDDELKGLALAAVWPGHMTVEELLAVLTPAKEESVAGAYHLFLSDGLAQHLQPDELVNALEWVEKQPPRHRRPYALGKAMDAITLQGWRHLESPDVLAAFARAAMSRLRVHNEIVAGLLARSFTEALGCDTEKRRRLVRAMLPLLSDPSNDPFWLVYPGRQLVIRDDVPWLIELLDITESTKTQRVLAELIRMAFDRSNSSHVNTIHMTSQTNPILAEAFAWLFKPVELDSPEAARMKERYEETQRLEQRRHQPRLLDPPPVERIAILLDQCESGDSGKFWRLNMEMTRDPHGTAYGDELQSDLTVLPGWKEADDATQARILGAAKRYVLEQEVETPKWVRKWLQENTLHRPAFAGYRALQLLLHQARGFVPSIPSDVWKRWAPIILAYPTSTGTGDEELHHRLVEIGYQHAPDEIIATLMLVIDKENSEGEHIFITRKLEGCWDERLADALLAKARDEKLKPKCMGHLLANLLEHQVGDAKTLAESLVSVPPPPSGHERSRAIVAARALVSHAQDAGWSVVWPAMEQDADFGREVVSAIAHALDWPLATISQRLTEDQFAGLYIWLVHQYPYGEDPERGRIGFVGPRQSVADFRDSILTHLSQHGTNEACQAIRRIAEELPELSWLRRTLLEAQASARRRTWVPPHPVEILQMAADQQARLVQSGDQLLEVLIESLRRLEMKLQGETAAAVDLWNEARTNRRTKYTPKEEARLSDYIKRHLQGDLSRQGVIVNREVEIRRGEKTDIHVDAVTRDQDKEVYDCISAIIEVKGCWNRDLDHAMESQLVARYLKDNRCAQGLYLVGWFHCDKWHSGDYRKKDAQRVAPDMGKAQDRFDEQAAELSQEGLRVRALVINAALR